GKASVFLNGTYAFLKYAFKDVKQPFSGTVNLGNVANNDGPKAPNSNIHYDHTVGKIRFVITINRATTETDLTISYAPKSTQLIHQVKQIAAGPLDATFKHTPYIICGMASVYINGKNAFLKYAFHDLDNGSFNLVVNLGQI
ncbi:hypothetical protein C0991_005565, partial [Blastosporella zonata]